MVMRGLAACALAALISVAGCATQSGAVQALTVQQLVERNAAARGGVEAWRAVQTMALSGHIETGNASTLRRAFVMEFKRPNKSRFEVQGERGKLIDTFDGRFGWMVRPAENGAPVLRRFGPEALRAAREAQGIDGLLIDQQARGIEVALEGVENVEGRASYRLAVTLPSRAKRRVWVDAATFLEIKSERESRRAGRRSVEAYYRDYRWIDGLLMATTIEVRRPAGAAAEKIRIDDIELNLTLSDARFARPTDLGRRDVPPRLQQSMDPDERPRATRLELAVP